MPRMRLRIPCSRREVMLKASAVNVVAITLIPAMPGHDHVELRVAANSAPKSRGTAAAAGS